ncbi:MAG: SRPBCC family protein [Gemmatimonadales bacterium]|nr:SRPBCC family protein [Gemmatimonadales bacterium]
MTHILRRTKVVPGSLPEVFAFHTDPMNLEALTPPWLAFKVLGSTDPVVRLGTRITYGLRLHGIPMRWESRISEFEEGRCFADEMLSGPYKRWYHRHTFRAVEGGVEIEDVVEYALPFGPLGRFAHALFVRRQLRQIFDYRAEAIDRLFPALPPRLSVMR